MYGTPRLPTIDETMMMWPRPLAPEDGQRRARRVVGAHVVDVEQPLHAAPASIWSMAP